MYKVVIQFDGSQFFGWQIQDEATRTVQSEFNKALKKIYKTEIRTTGSGRTDTGVHSLQHHVVFHPPFEIKPESLVKALNTHLPEDIKAIDCHITGDNFRPTNDAKRKEYNYFFSNLKIESPISRNIMANNRFDLNLDQMQKACELFVGEHNFNSFHCVGSDPNSTIRKIESCVILKQSESMSGAIPKHYVIKIVGNGFLKQMVRLIVGAIWDVGRGRLGVEDIEIALKNANGKHIAPVAPASGLFKISVDYSDSNFDK